MHEIDRGFFFPCMNQKKDVFYLRTNYKSHISKHREIRGEVGLLEIEKTLLTPHIITEYKRKFNGVSRVLSGKVGEKKGTD